mgnify:CR=1 FL=1
MQKNKNTVKAINRNVKSSPRKVNLLLKHIRGKKADIAIRVGPQADSMLHQKKLGSVDTLFVSTKAYLNSASAIEEPADLKQHRLIGTTLRNKWQLTNTQTNATYTHMCRFASTFNDTGFVKYLVCDEQGIALLPRFEVIDELKSPAGILIEYSVVKIGVVELSFNLDGLIEWHRIFCLS